MEATGERFVPELTGDIKYEHLHRYALALEFVEGRSVLDIASGEGYGSAILAKRARSVIGVDIDPDAIDHAQTQYRDLANLEFLVGTCSAIPVADSSIDVVVSFETIEHHDQHEEMMREIKRVLKTDGVLIISSPNRLTYSDEPQYSNPFHVKELYYEELCDLLKRHFQQVYLYGQKLAVGSWVTSLEPSNERAIKVYSGDVHKLENVVTPSQDPIYFVAICSDRTEPFSETVESTYADSSDDLLVQARKETQVAQSALQSMQQSLQHYQQQLDVTQQQLGSTHQQLSSAHQQLDSTHQELSSVHQQLDSTHQQLGSTHQQLEQANAIIQWMEGSRFWKLRLTYLKLRQKLLPRRSMFQQTATIPVPPVVVSGSYLSWQKNNAPRPADLQKLTETIEILPHKPLISVIMPVFNPPEAFLRDAIESVIQQIYPHWELCIADDASTVPHVQAVLKQYQSQDSRIKVVFRQTNGNISRSSNSALELATGEFIALLDHDDLLTPDALYEMALLINRQPQIDMIYSDEDKIDEKEHLRDPFFKPDWCPDSFLSRMYTCHLGAYRRSLVNQIGGFRPGFEGSQDYDLVLRFTEKTDKIAHIPKILYHWRMHDRSTASSIKTKSYAIEAAEKAIAEALQRRGEPGQVAAAKGNCCCYIVRYDIHDFKPVTIIIPTRNLGSMLDRCLTSIFSKTTYPNYEVLVVDNGSTESETFSVFDRWQKQEPKRFRCLPLDIPFNFSKLNNAAVQQSQADYFLFLNNDIEVITPEWLTTMVEQAQRPTIGAVGARLLYPDGTIQHAGVVAGIGGVAGHSHKHFPGDQIGYFSQIQAINNYAAVTAACLMCRRDVFEKVGGFEEELAIAFNDVDLCFKMLEKGYRNVYLPHAVLYHYESKSRGYEDTPEKQVRFQKEILYMQRKWKAIIANDPCYSPHLTKEREDYSPNV